MAAQQTQQVAAHPPRNDTRFPALPRRTPPNVCLVSNPLQNNCFSTQKDFFYKDEGISIEVVRCLEDSSDKNNPLILRRLLLEEVFPCSNKCVLVLPSRYDPSHEIRKGVFDLMYERISLD